VARAPDPAAPGMRRGERHGHVGARAAAAVRGARPPRAGRGCGRALAGPRRRGSGPPERSRSPLAGRLRPCPRAPRGGRRPVELARVRRRGPRIRRPPRGGRGAAAARDDGVVGGVVARPGVRGPLPEARGAERGHVEAPDLRALGRGDRGAHDVPAGAHRRAPQLGLPVLLAPGRGHDDPRLPRRRLPPGGGGVRLLDPARDAAHLAGGAGALRHLRQSATRGAGAGAPLGLPGIRPGAGRERGARAAPAGRVRRGRGGRGRAPASRRHAGPLDAPVPAGDRRHGRAPVARAGPGNLGDPRGAPASHAFQVPMLVRAP